MLSPRWQFLDFWQRGLHITAVGPGARLQVSTLLTSHLGVAVLEHVSSKSESVQCILIKSHEIIDVHKKRQLLPG